VKPSLLVAPSCYGACTLNGDWPGAFPWCRQVHLCPMPVFFAGLEDVT
jgi:hypothetical protein